MVYQVERDRRRAALRGKNGGKLEIDSWQETPHDDAPGLELLRREGIADRNPEPG